MKYAVISYPESMNIGDEIQSVAAARLLPKVDYFLPRESLHKPAVDEKVKLICNGWFMTKPHNWPPAPNIEPLFISFHVTDSNKSYKLIPNRKLVDYYKQFEPIGCRDLKTKQYFDAIGVKTYFSNCLTLTLENKFTERNDDILLVDPFRYNYTKEYRKFLMENMVPKKYRDAVKIVGHRYYKKMSVEEKFAEAERLIDMYSKAKLVITSRIHAALPCLALGTPVYFVDAGYHSTRFNLNDRFEGIIDLFNVIDESYFPFSSKSLFDRFARVFKIYKTSDIKPLPIDWDNPEPNKDDFKQYAQLIRAKVKEFINK